MNNIFLALNSSITSIENVDKVFISLEEKKDQSEKIKESPFHKFNDKEILFYFLHKRKNIDRQKDNSPRTRKEYWRELTQMIQQMLTYPKEIGWDIEDLIEGSFFKSLSGRHLKRYLDWVRLKSPHVQKRGSYSAATIARKTVIIKSFFSFLYEVKYIKEPIHQSILSATVKKEERPNRDLGPAEVIRLLDFFKSEGHPILFGMIQVLVSTGLRNEEFCSLKVSDVRYNSTMGMCYLNVMGKGNKERMIPLREKTFESIKEFRAARLLTFLPSSDDHSPLFPNSKGNQYVPSHLSRYLAKAIERTELDFLREKSNRITPHTFRHAFAIISYKAGVDVYAIMRSLGHTKIETTMIYLSKIFELEQHAIHKWNEKVLKDYI